MKIYADNAATTRMSRTAIDAMIPYMENVYGNPSSLYSIGQEAKEALEEAREKVAAVINADPKEILFTSGGSEADNQALRSAAEIGKRKGKKHIISSAFEHHAILHTLQRLEKEGFEVTLLPVHEDGLVRVDELEAAIREDTCLVSIMTANNEIGTIVCHKHGVLFHTDAVQAVGHLPIDVKAMQIDMLSASGHKFHGPKGVGFLYARKGIALTNLIEGGAQEKGKRAGTENVPGIMSMAAALQEAAANLEQNAAHQTALRDRLIKGLSEIPHSALNGDAGRQGHQRILRERLHLRIPRSQPRPPRHRPRPRRRPRIPPPQPGRGDHRGRGRLHRPVRQGGRRVPPQLLPRLERPHGRKDPLHPAVSEASVNRQGRIQVVFYRSETESSGTNRQGGIQVVFFTGTVLFADF